MYNSPEKSISDLSKKVFFSIFILIICRIGTYIPVVGLNIEALGELVQRNQSGILGMFNILSGGSLARMSIFALAIMPYITASIIMQLLSLAYPALANIRKEGEIGRKKIAQYSRYLTVILATLQAYGLAVSLEGMTATSGSIVLIPGLFFRTSTVITLVVGTMLLMWLGEQITNKGIGNGTSLIIFVGIISTVPSSIISILELSRKGTMSLLVVLIIPVSLILTIALIIFFEQSHRRILIQYPKRQIGNRVSKAESTHLPIKLNTSGVIPPIFASSLLLFPLTITNFMNTDSSIMQFISYNLSHGRPLFIILYAALIILFSFFYTAIVFNSTETAENLKKYGAYIAGKRPGKNTAEYLDYLLVRLTTVGSLYLCVVCIIPEVYMSKLSIIFSLGGTSLLIVVNVILETFNQIQAFLFSGKYKTLIKKIKTK